MNDFGSSQEFRVSNRPAQQRQKIPKRLGKKPFVAVRSDAGCAVTLGKPRAVRPQNQRHVRKNRRRSAQRAIQQRLLRRIGNVIGAANHVRNPHIDVVHDYAQLIHRPAARLAFLGRSQQNEILNLLVGNFARTKNGVLEWSDRAQRNAKTDGRIFRAESHLSFAARAPCDAPRSRLFFRVLGFLDRIAARIFFRGAIAIVRRAYGSQFDGRLPMHFQPLRLKVRPFVPIDAEPSQAIQDSLNQFRPIAFHVRILNAQNHRAAMAARKQPIEKSRARASHMQIARRRRGKPNANFAGRLSRYA